jgi:hypothetical protein
MSKSDAGTPGNAESGGSRVDREKLFRLSPRLTGMAFFLIGATCRQHAENDSASGRPRTAPMANRQSCATTTEGCGFAAAEKPRGLVGR